MTIPRGRLAAPAPRSHWFLPANGDGRVIVGGGHGVATAPLMTPLVR